MHLFDLQPEDLVEKVKDVGDLITLSEARKVLSHILGNGKTDFDLKIPIRKTLQQTLASQFSLQQLKIVERIKDDYDKSVRYLFETHDKLFVEAVRIPLLKPNHFSICLSSQVGCAMACDFCATGRLGLKRNLEPWEIISQFWQIRAETEGRLSGAVFMGQGEPFHNYDNVIRAARQLSSPTGCKIGSDNITISTVGLVPQIKRYTDEGHSFRLVVSLTSAVAEKRKSLLPIAAKYPLEELAEAIKAYVKKSKDRITLAWVMMKGLNTGKDEVEALKKLLGDTPYKFNLIDVNDARPEGYKRADEFERRAFYHLLQELHVPIVRRYSVGNSRHSACGMLAGKKLSEIENTI